ncbi:MAG: ATP-binding cassette domain-containing protein, partial [Lachnospiraceae bacterium]|nr:ATP-binding cassette domain-containing protein [Lachnospiraceae bacterium]
AEYYAFNTAYGSLSVGMAALASIAASIARIRPSVELIQPILTTVSEDEGNRMVITSLSGEIELNNVTFRYDKGPAILNNISFKINPGEYVAITGKSGSGKSTLMRILLGFENPKTGAVYYDGRDLQDINLRSIRRKIGTVMQDGKLFGGTIYENIATDCPDLSEEDAWEAAEIAGIADDIRRMPKQMNTLITEGGGSISGGQRQRLLIARAIAPKPRILFMDEATSALDNETQKKVSEALDRLNSTRVVIAHRLSTIRQCDRIIVVDNGSIVEDGTYDELIEKGGFFAELVSRQQL